MGTPAPDPGALFGEFPRGAERPAFAVSARQRDSEAEASAPQGADGEGRRGGGRAGSYECLLHTD